MINTTIGFFDESGDLGKGSDYYVVVMVLFNSPTDALKAKSILKRERKNNKRFKHNEFKFTKLHNGNKYAVASLNRVLRNLSDCNFDCYAIVVEKPEKKFAFDIARKRLVFALFEQLCENGQINKHLDLRADNNLFGTTKQDHKRFVFCKSTGNGKKPMYIHRELSYEEFKEFQEPDDELVRRVLKDESCCLDDWKLFTIKAKDSSTEGGIQIADLFAGSIFQKFNNDNKEYYDIISSKVTLIDL